MTIKHIALFKFKPELSNQEIDSIMQAIKNLKNLIPQVLSFSGGVNNSIENLSRGFTHGFIMEFNNETDRKTYLDHPEHVKLVQDILLPALEDGINTPVIFDYQS